MLFGSKAPLWRYILGIFTLAIGARQVAVLAISGVGQSSTALAVYAGAQALGALVIAFGLFGMRNRLVGVGAVVTAIGVVLASVWKSGHGTTAVGFTGAGSMLVVLAILGLAFDHLSRQDAREDGDDLRAPVLTARQAEHFAARMPHLHGGSTSDVSVQETRDGHWRVRAHGQTHELDPMTEPDWQRWLKRTGSHPRAHS